MMMVCNNFGQNLITNQDDIVREVWKTPEYKLLQEAGVSCEYIVKLKVSSDLRIVNHKVKNPCHPIYEKLMEKYLKQLKINPGLINSKRRYTWITWRLKFRLFH